MREGCSKLVAGKDRNNFIGKQEEHEITLCREQTCLYGEPPEAQYHCFSNLSCEVWEPGSFILKQYIEMGILYWLYTE